MHIDSIPNSFWDSGD